MPITVNCACGKVLRVADAHAGKRAKCPGCGAVLPVPEPGAFDDFEVLDETPAAASPAPTDKPAAPARVKAAVAEEEPPAADKPRKKKKKRKKAAAADGDDYERALEQQQQFVRAARAIAYIVCGLLIIGGVGYMLAFRREDIKSVSESDGRIVLGLAAFGVLGLAAVGKGALGLLTGQGMEDPNQPG